LNLSASFSNNKNVEIPSSSGQTSESNRANKRAINEHSAVANASKFV